VSLVVPTGRIVGLVGESGSGKSTMARAAVGLAPLESGRILLDGQPVPPRGRRRPVQMIFQDPFSSLDPRMTIGDSIAESIPERLSRSGRNAEIARLLEIVHLDPGRSALLPGHLSGGQRQRVALARELIAGARVVVLDDPMSAVDTHTERHLVENLRPALAGRTVLIATQRLSTVEVADRAIVLDDGVVVEAGTPKELLAAGGLFASLFGEEVSAAA
jgi:peptide/nickel transport system ATP-binding protein